MKQIILLCFLTMLLACRGVEVKSFPQKSKVDSNYSFGRLKWKGNWIKKDTTGLHYPCVLDSVIYTFFVTWEDSVTYQFKNLPDSNLAMINHSTGMWARNAYGLWTRTCLVEYFWSKGIFHPDDMSAIMLTTYHRYLNGKPLELEKQIAMYQQFWKDHGIVYKLDDIKNWEFPPSMWDMEITNYQTTKNE